MRKCDTRAKLGPEFLTPLTKIKMRAVQRWINVYDKMFSFRLDTKKPVLLRKYTSRVIDFHRNKHILV